MIVLGSDEFAKQLAEKLKVNCLILEKKSFPDKELCPRIQEEVNDNHVIFVNRMEFPEIDSNTYLIESFLVLRTLKAIGIEHIDFVMPYMVYGRQDKMFSKGEPVSAKYILDLLADAGVSSIFTVSSHYERDKDILSAKIPVYNINGFQAISEYIKKLDIENPLITGADFGVSAPTNFVSNALGHDSIVFEKERDFQSGEIELKGLIQAKNRNVVVIDDVISSGSTIIKAIEICRKSEAKSVSAFALHGIFAGDSLEKLQKITSNFAVSDTIQTPVSQISMVDIISEKLRETI